MKQKICLIALLSLLVGLVMQTTAGCAQTSQEKYELWVLTEKSNSDGMNLQAEIIAERMEIAYPGVTIILDVLPTEEDQRELKLTQLRTQIMSGNGPDVYLLPTGSELICDEPERDANITIAPLFPDVQLAMRNGVFLDISQYYLKDSQLQGFGLNQSIMDAGAIEGKRYVLPLRYNVPVIYTNPDLWTEYGLSDATFQSDCFTFAETVLSLDRASEAAIGLKLPEELETLGELVDYGKGEILLPEQTLQDYFDLYQRRNLIAAETTQAFYEKWDHQRRKYHLYQGREDGGWEFIDEIAWPRTGKFHHECFNLLTEYTFQNYHWLSCDLPLYTGCLSDALETIGVARITGQNFKIYPLRSGTGDIQAIIAYWGGVGSSCNNPELAYAFLRHFFEEEFQGEAYRPRANREGPWWTWEHEPQAMRLIEDSLPVRANDCVSLLWNNLQYQTKMAINSSIRETLVKVQTVQRETVTAYDVPGLAWDIDHVYFPITLDQDDSLAYALDLVSRESEQPNDALPKKLSKEILLSLWWHLAEG